VRTGLAVCDGLAGAKFRFQANRQTEFDAGCCYFLIFVCDSHLDCGDGLDFSGTQIGGCDGERPVFCGNAGGSLRADCCPVID